MLAMRYLRAGKETSHSCAHGVHHAVELHELDVQDTRSLRVVALARELLKIGVAGCLDQLLESPVACVRPFVLILQAQPDVVVFVVDKAFVPVQTSR